MSTSKIIYLIIQNEYFVQFREEIESAQYNSASVGIHFSKNSTPYRTGVRYLAQVARSLAMFIPDDKRSFDDSLLSDFSKVLCSSGDVLQFINTIDVSFLPEVSKQRLSDLKNFCCISHERAVSLLNQHSLKGFYDDFVDEWYKFKDIEFDFDFYDIDPSDSSLFVGKEDFNDDYVLSE